MLSPPLAFPRISIHALRVEGDCLTSISCSAEGGFLSTPSGWRATCVHHFDFLHLCISIHALRVEGDEIDYVLNCMQRISIHALRVEGDRSFSKKNFDLFVISIHALRVEGDVQSITPTRRSRIFLSTPSGWRATSCYLHQTQNPHISIHALRVEGDFDLREPTAAPEIFLSTPSGWRATPFKDQLTRTIFYFYPRPPGGGRRQAFFQKNLDFFRFLSTPSGWRATTPLHACSQLPVFLSTPSGWRATHVENRAG